MGRKTFTALALTILFLNLLFDYRIYKQNQITEATGEWVNQSHAILSSIDKLLHTTERATNERAVPNLREPIEGLRELLPTDSAMLAAVQQLQATSEADTAHPENRNLQTIAILNAMRTEQEDAVTQRLAEDRKANANADVRILEANLLDAVLTFSLVIFFWYEWISHRRTQETLIRSMDRVKSVNELLRAADLKTANRVKSAVHDLKNPLGSIRGFAELIREESRSSQSVTEMSEIIQRISDNTLSLVNSMLLAHSESDAAPDLEKVDLRSCVADVCGFLKPVAAQKNQIIELKNAARPCTFMADVDRIHDVLYNLLGNALKFSPPASRVTVICQKIGGFAEIEIIDQGPGFQSGDMSQLFMPGKTLSARPTGNEVSTGMGLFSAKHVIELHAGKIQIANHEDGGARITIRFPLVENDVLSERPLDL